MPLVSDTQRQARQVVYCNLHGKTEHHLVPLPCSAPLWASGKAEVLPCSTCPAIHFTWHWKPLPNTGETPQTWQTATREAAAKTLWSSTEMQVEGGNPAGKWPYSLLPHLMRSSSSSSPLPPLLQSGQLFIKKENNLKHTRIHNCSNNTHGKIKGR